MILRGLFILFLFLFGTISVSISQIVVSGRVTDERNDPIPYSKIYLKNMTDQRTICDVNGYYELRLMPGEYFLVVNATGFQERESYLTVNDKPVTKDIQLFPSTIKDFEDMDIQSKKTNPGREIMLKVVEKRDKISLWNYPHSVEVYIKASEKLDRKNQPKKETKKPESDVPFEDEVK
ncbi:MAG: carboxypeptidase regulatory-like domain-containing protein, partial [Bacteroidota bacterium]